MSRRTSPLELSSAYATLANDGRYCPPTPLRKIVGPDGNSIALPERSCQQVITPGIAHTVTTVLEKDTSVPGGTAVVRGAGRRQPPDRRQDRHRERPQAR